MLRVGVVARECLLQLSRAHCAIDRVFMLFTDCHRRLRPIYPLSH